MFTILFTVLKCCLIDCLSTQSAERGIVVKKISLLGLYYDSNYGDAVICECTKYIVECLLQTQRESADIEIVDMAARSRFDHSAELGERNKPICSVFRRVLTPVFEVVPFYSHVKYRLKKDKDIQRWLEKKLCGSDLIIFAGGSVIKFKQQNIYLLVNSVISVACKLNIPVIFHAAGVEGYSSIDPRCRLLRSAITRPVVKSITVRDDYNVLDNSYLSEVPRITRAPTVDSAVWASEAFGICADECATTIGIGVIRAEIFEEYGYKVTGLEVMEMYCHLVDELRKKDLECVLFTNGSKQDNESMFKIKTKIKDIEAIYPRTPRELVQIISTFRGVVSGRLHANIIAFSLDIPSVGLVWNDKLHQWGDKIGYPERFVAPDKFSPQLIVESLCKAIADGYDVEAREKLRKRTFQSLATQLKDL